MFELHNIARYLCFTCMPPETFTIYPFTYKKGRIPIKTITKHTLIILYIHFYKVHSHAKFAYFIVAPQIPR